MCYWWWYLHPSALHWSFPISTFNLVIGWQWQYIAHKLHSAFGCNGQYATSRCILFFSLEPNQFLWLLMSLCSPCGIAELSFVCACQLIKFICQPIGLMVCAFLSWLHPAWALSVPCLCVTYLIYIIVMPLPHPFLPTAIYPSWVVLFKLNA